MNRDQRAQVIDFFFEKRLFVRFFPIPIVAQSQREGNFAHQVAVSGAFLADVEGHQMCAKSVQFADEVE